jgi:c-di-GMP-binding flagellar brake protein YcgR
MNSVANADDSLANDKTSQHIISHSTSYRVKSRSEITSLLNKLLKNHTLLSIALADSAKIFGSMLLEVNSEKPYLVLDELYPRNELKESLLHKKLSIETQFDGIEIRFTVKVEAVAKKDEVEYYKVSYPAHVFHHQRRSSYRVNVGISDSVPLALSTENDVLLHAELRDISLGGVSARINSPTTETFAVGDEIPTCIIHTPDGKKIVSSLEVSRIEEGNSPQSLRIGARFIHIAAADRHELSKLIAKLDRENIKKLKRLSNAN